MKIFTYLAVGFVLFSFSTQCRKQDSFQVVDIHLEQLITRVSSFNYQRNEKKILSNARLFITDGKCRISSYVIPSQELYWVTEHFYINNIPFAPGIYPVSASVYPENPAQIYVGLYWNNFDAGFGTLKSSNDYPSDFIEITAANADQKTLEGKFEFHLKKWGNNSPEPGLPDSLLISKGDFFLIAE